MRKNGIRTEQLIRIVDAGVVGRRGEELPCEGDLSLILGNVGLDMESGVRCDNVA